MFSSSLAATYVALSSQHPRHSLYFRSAPCLLPFGWELFLSLVCWFGGGILLAGCICVHAFSPNCRAQPVPLADTCACRHACFCSSPRRCRIAGLLDELPLLPGKEGPALKGRPVQVRRAPERHLLLPLARPLCELLQHILHSRPLLRRGFRRARARTNKGGLGPLRMCAPEGRPVSLLAAEPGSLRCHRCHNLCSERPAHQALIGSSALPLAGRQPIWVCARGRLPEVADFYKSFLHLPLNNPV